MIGDQVTLYDRKRDNAEQFQVINVLDEMISIDSLEDRENRKRMHWQKCDTDKLIYGNVFFSLDRSKIRKEILIARRQNRMAQSEQQNAHAYRMEDDQMADQQQHQNSTRNAQGGNNQDLSEYGSSEEE